jgi:hypothetical protein
MGHVCGRREMYNSILVWKCEGNIPFGVSRNILVYGRRYCEMDLKGTGWVGADFVNLA